MPSNIESDSSIEVIPPDASNNGADGQIETDGYVVVQPIYLQGGSVSLPPSAPLYHPLRTPESRSSNAFSGVVNLGFYHPQRAPGSGSGRNTNQLAPTVNRVNLTPNQYATYSSTPTINEWYLLHQRFAEAKDKINQLDRRNKETQQRFNQATSHIEILNIVQEVGAGPRPYAESDATALIEDFQNSLQIALGTVQANNFHSLDSLVSPVETSHSLEWARGNFSFIYDSLLRSLQRHPSNPQMDIYSQYAVQVREQVFQFSRNPESQENIPYYQIDNFTQDIERAQTIANRLVDHINNELRRGVRSFHFTYSGIPSPFNLGGLYLFVIQDAAIIISPHFGVLIGHDIDGAVQYIINYTLLLAVNGISNKIHIRKVKANRSE
ncbi:hypothetical protein [Endozoicomonas euniceicola]|uniref:Uncharacterized protein n=1 Tax=Endozoicomonas euniceicola TaxID=1234143 RepID=A0ABY6GWT2_9GAMM|nr:hypothetical protein [Endozoicomonas euniceicola]UYM17242.1 hypothetical protein NX720_04780 [Endozoicomonas euniceicola]